MQTDENINLKDKSQRNFQVMPRNKIKAYRVFRNSTFKLVSPAPSSSIKKINDFQGDNHSNSSALYINKISKDVMMNKISQIASPYYQKAGKNSFQPFKRIIPHPIIDDNRFKHLLDEAIMNESSTVNISEKNISQKIENDMITTSIINLGNIQETKTVYTDVELPRKSCKDIHNSKLDLNNIEEYEKMLMNKLDEIRLLKEKPKYEPLDENVPKCKDFDHIFVYNSNNDYLTIQNEENEENEPLKQNIILPITAEKEFNDNILNSKYLYSIKNQLFESSLIEIEPEPFTSKNEILTHNISVKKKEIIEYKKNEITKSNVNLSTEFEVDVEDIKLIRDNTDESLTHLPLFFKCPNGKKIRFKIRYDGKMGHAFKVFSSKMNIILLSDINFTTTNGCLINSLDTPKSLGLKPYDVILVLT